MIDYQKLDKCCSPYHTYDRWLFDTIVAHKTFTKTCGETNHIWHLLSGEQMLVILNKIDLYRYMIINGKEVVYVPDSEVQYD